ARRPPAHRAALPAKRRPGRPTVGGRRAVSCAEIEARLVDAADGRLDLPAQVRLHAHLDGCAACRERAGLGRGLVPGMRTLVPPPPDAMQARRMQLEIERRLAAAGAPAPRRSWSWARRAVPAAVGLAAAAAALIVALPRIRGGGAPVAV